MTFKIEFNKKLNDAFKRRTRWLRDSIWGATPGKPHKWTKKERAKIISDLQGIAENAFAGKFAKRELKEHSTKRWYQVVGSNREKKKSLFIDWYNRTIDNDSCVYIFFKKDRALYVGRTENGKNRPASHFDTFRTTGVTRVTIHKINNVSQLGKLECLTWHNLRPMHNKKTPPNNLYEKKCPLCEIHDYIASELKEIFNFK